MYFCYISRYRFIVSTYVLGPAYFVEFTCTVSKHLRMISFCLQRLRNSADTSLTRVIYQMLLESKLRYEITIYASCSSFKEQRINNLIIRMVRNISQGTQLVNQVLEEELAELHLWTIHKLRKFVFLTNHCFTSEFKMNTTKQRHLRKRKKFQIPKIYIHYGARLRNFYVLTYFNQLPENLRTLHSLSSVEKKMRKWCIQVTEGSLVVIAISFTHYASSAQCQIYTECNS